MSTNKKRVLIESNLEKPALSLAEDRWEVFETELTVGAGDIKVVEKEMFEVVGKKDWFDSINAAAEALVEEASFLPGRFWLICDDDNEHDDQAVGAHAIVGKYAYHVGFLNKRQARKFRKSMASFVLDGLSSLEVLGCITKGKTSSYLNTRFDLPLDFAELVNGGCTYYPENRPSWLLDASPVNPRPWQGRDAKGFTDDELRKIYCWYARKKMWNSLPHRCEWGADRLRNCGDSVPEPMASFVLNPDNSVLYLQKMADENKDLREPIKKFRDLLISNSKVIEDPSATDEKRVLVDSILDKPALSLTEIRWVIETEENDDGDDGDTIHISVKEMFEVVGEQYRFDSINAAAEALVEEASFLPGRFWLICDDDNEHDDQAVGAHAIVGKYAYHVGFLNKRQARKFRKSMASFVLDGLSSLEVLGCITKGKTSSYLNAWLYLPVDFAELMNDGYTDKPENRPSWLLDASTVTPRPWQGRYAEGFTDDELCKIYCWCGKQKMFNSLPDRCEWGAGMIRGGDDTRPMESFVLLEKPTDAQ